MLAVGHCWYACASARLQSIASSVFRSLWEWKKFYSLLSVQCWILLQERTTGDWIISTGLKVFPDVFSKCISRICRLFRNSSPDHKRRRNINAVPSQRESKVFKQLQFILQRRPIGGDLLSTSYAVLEICPANNRPRQITPLACATLTLLLSPTLTLTLTVGIRSRCPRLVVPFDLRLAVICS